MEITKERLEQIRCGLLYGFWEDTRLVTEPNHIDIGLDIGTLNEIIELAEQQLRNNNE